MSPAARNLPGYKGLVGTYRRQPEQQQQAQFEQNTVTPATVESLGGRARALAFSDEPTPPAFGGKWIDADSGESLLFGGDNT